MASSNQESPIQSIRVVGAREHNLKNISAELPKQSLVVVTGVSGSGKSSFAFDTIYAEGQRRYMETFGAYARQFMGELERPDVDLIEGLSPVISIEQKTTSKNPRSTVGTTTELYDFFRLLFARAAYAYSSLGNQLKSFSEEQILDSILDQFHDAKVAILAPLIRARKGHYRELFDQIRKKGYLKAKVDGEIVDITPDLRLDRYKTHDIDVVIDRIKINSGENKRIRNGIEAAVKMGEGQLSIYNYEDDSNTVFSKHLMDEASGEAIENPSPNTFSFNSPYGACPKCKGLGYLNQVDMELVIPDPTLCIADGGLAPLGESRDNLLFKQIKKLGRKFKFSLTTPIEDIDPVALNLILYANEDGSEPSDKEIQAEDRWYTLVYGGLTGLLLRCFTGTSSESMRKWAESYMRQQDCPSCKGYRLKEESLRFKIADKHIGQIAQFDFSGLQKWLTQVPDQLDDYQSAIAQEILKEISTRLGFILNVGLDYLSMDRATRTLSGGEAQRIRLATQIGSELSGITYILDEPTIGLHQRDNATLIAALKDLVARDNTVIVVEHDKDLMLSADHLIDIGPGAGEHGGEIIGAGTPEEFIQNNGTTASYLTGKKGMPLPEYRRNGSGKSIQLFGARGNNLKNVDLSIPLGKLICVSGVSGSGKSSLINDTLYPIIRQKFYNSLQDPLPFDTIEGLEHIDKVIDIDQSPIGRTPRSNPATYTDVFGEIRKLLAEHPEAKARGYKPGRFSFNVKGGRCETCQGAGVKLLEMNFLPSVHVHCESCNGQRYNRETLEIYYKGKNIYDILNMTIEDACEFFKPIPKINRKLETLLSVGLGYIRLGQPSTTLSGGEAQRVKLASELSKRDTGNTLYILDEPTTGLHFQDVEILVNVLQELVEKGNTVLVIEHNLEIIRMADHLIDIGPEGGRRGGKIVAEGTPEEVSEHLDSATAIFLKEELEFAQKLKK